MRSLGWLSLITLLASAEAQAACPLHGTRNFTRMADLPPGALAALRYPMAERGAPFQAGDSLVPGSRLPTRRFVSARQAGCTLTIRYQQGGIALREQTAVLERRGDRWLVLRVR